MPDEPTVTTTTPKLALAAFLAVTATASLTYLVTATAHQDNIPRCGPPDGVGDGNATIEFPVRNAHALQEFTDAWRAQGWDVEHETYEHGWIAYAKCPW